MKINEVLKEGLYDNPTRSSATGKNYFIKSVTNQIFAYMDSARQSGQPISTWEFVQGYLSKYGWVANTQQQQQLEDICKEVDAEYNKYNGQPQQQTTQASQPATNNTAPGPETGIEPTMEGVLDNVKSWGKQYFNQKMGQAAGKLGFGLVNKLANAMYMVGMSQIRDPKTGKVRGAVGQPSQPSPGQSAFGQMANQLEKPDDATVDPKGQQVINTVKTLKGEQYEKDLQEIVKLALWNLYGADKGDYGDFVKQIMTQKSSAKNPATQQA